MITRMEDLILHGSEHLNSHWKGNCQNNQLWRKITGYNVMYNSDTNLVSL